MLTDAKVKKPDGLDHGDIYFTISQKPDKNVSYEPQFITSYDMQESSKAIVTVGDKSFSMFTKGRYAWVENAAEEPRLIAAMKAGSTMKVAAKSKRGNPTSYVFSLKGISAALDPSPAVAPTPPISQRRAFARPCVRADPTQQ